VFTYCYVLMRIRLTMAVLLWMNTSYVVCFALEESEIKARHASWFHINCSDTWESKLASISALAFCPGVFFPCGILSRGIMSGIHRAKQLPTYTKIHQIPFITFWILSNHADKHKNSRENNLSAEIINSRCWLTTVIVVPHVRKALYSWL